jgi:hypothetical protein
VLAQLRAALLRERDRGDSLRACPQEAWQCVIPPATLDEQRTIAAVLADMHAGIAVLEDKLGKVRAVKQGMMQVPTTGETRLV